MRLAFLPFAFLLGPGAASGVDLYTLPESLPFEIPVGGSTIRGTFDPASPADAGAWDLSTDGHDPDAPPGTHACADLGFNPFVYCAMGDIDVFAFRLTLAGDSAPVSQAGPAFSPFVQTAFGGSAYVIPEESSSERVPVSSSSGNFQIQKFDEPMNAAFYLQPGETTVWLLSRYEGGAIAAGLMSGMTLRMNVTSGTLGSGQTQQIGIMNVPEPGMLLARVAAVAALLAVAARRVRVAARVPRSDESALPPATEVELLGC